MSAYRRSLLLGVVLVLSLAGCSAAPPGGAEATVLPLATPSSMEITAGICGRAVGSEVVLILEPGIPNPRCSIVTAGQVLRVVNRTGAAVTVTLGRETISLAPDAEAAFKTPFGQALLPGVHVVLVDPCCGGEIWFQGE